VSAGLAAWRTSIPVAAGTASVKECRCCASRSAIKSPVPARGAFVRWFCGRACKVIPDDLPTSVGVGSAISIETAPVPDDRAMEVALDIRFALDCFPAWFAKGIESAMVPS
jgi:hypothetical protein